MNLALNNQTMSSREIADLTGKRHDNVKRTMESLCELGLISITQIEEPTKGGGKPATVYHVGEDDSYVVVARLSPEFTARIVKRWRELENKKQPLWVAQLSPEATIMLNDLSSQLEHKTQHVAQLESLFHSGGTIAQFVKQLNGVNSQRVKREANKKHASMIMKQTKGSLMAIGLSEEDAKSVTLALKNGKIANVGTINF